MMHFCILELLGLLTSVCSSIEILQNATSASGRIAKQAGQQLTSV